MNKNRSKAVVAKQLRKKSYKNVLKTARSDNKRMTVMFSKLIHGYGMESVHEYLSRVVFNSKSLISASLVSLVGTLFSITMAEIYGYQYNYLLFVYFFVAGYLASTIYLSITFKLKG